MNIPERTCGTQVILGLLVQANLSHNMSGRNDKFSGEITYQNRPAGKMMPPTIIGMSLSSGKTWPFSLRRRAYRVFE